MLPLRLPADLIAGIHPAPRLPPNLLILANGNMQSVSILSLVVNATLQPFPWHWALTKKIYLQLRQRGRRERRSRNCHYHSMLPDIRGEIKPFVFIACANRDFTDMFAITYYEIKKHIFQGLRWKKKENPGFASPWKCFSFEATN